VFRIKIQMHSIHLTWRPIAAMETRTNNEKGLWLEIYFQRCILLERVAPHHNTKRRFQPSSGGGSLNPGSKPRPYPITKPVVRRTLSDLQKKICYSMRQENGYTHFRIYLIQN
jgi:hypothetical protein